MMQQMQHNININVDTTDGPREPYFCSASCRVTLEMEKKTGKASCFDASMCFGHSAVFRVSQAIYMQLEVAEHCPAVLNKRVIRNKGCLNDALDADSMRWECEESLP